MEGNKATQNIQKNSSQRHKQTETALSRGLDSERFISVSFFNTASLLKWFKLCAFTVCILWEQMKNREGRDGLFSLMPSYVTDTRGAWLAISLSTSVKMYYIFVVESVDTVELEVGVGLRMDGGVDRTLLDVSDFSPRTWWHLKKFAAGNCCGLRQVIRFPRSRLPTKSQCHSKLL